MAKVKEDKSKTNKALSIIAAIFIIFLVLVGVGAALNSRNVGLKPSIAVIPLQGEIGINSDIDPDTISKLLDKADEDISVKAIILEINSPGGSGVASQEIAEAVAKARKPVVAWIREVGASGAFWIATSADRVVAAPGSVVGSIGVSSSYIDFANLMEKQGITYNRLVTGEFKDTGTPFRNLTFAERSYILQKLEIIKNVFVQSIANNRNLTFEYVDSKATGEIWLGSEALQLGFIDVLGGKDESQKTAEQLAGITDSRLVSFEQRRPTLLDLIGANNNFAFMIGRGIGSIFLEVGNGQNLPQFDA